MPPKALGITENICVVIPAFCEAARIGTVVRGVRRQGIAVVVVDEGPPDATGATILRHTAYDCARAHGYSAIVTMDGKGQHDPADLPALPGIASAPIRTIYAGEPARSTP